MASVLECARARDLNGPPFSGYTRGLPGRRARWQLCVPQDCLEFLDTRVNRNDSLLKIRVRAGPGRLDPKLGGRRSQLADLLAKHVEVTRRICDACFQRAGHIKHRSHDTHQLGKVLDLWTVFDKGADHPGVSHHFVTTNHSFGWGHGETQICQHVSTSETWDQASPVP